MIGLAAMEGRHLPVLVVDDQPLMRSLVARLLKALEFQRADIAENAIEAFDLIRKRSYRLIISDFQMEPMTGLELLRSVRSDLRMRDTCFVMMAAGTDIEQVTAAACAGMDGYLLK